MQRLSDLLNPRFDDAVLVLHTQFEDAVLEGDTEKIRELLLNPAFNISRLGHSGLIYIAAINDLELTKLLLSDSRFNVTEFLKTGDLLGLLEKGTPEIIELLLYHPKCDSEIWKNVGLRFLNKITRPEIVKLLLKMPGGSVERITIALRSTAMMGQIDIMQILLEDPQITSEMLNEAVVGAIKKSQLAIVKLLLQDSRLKDLDYSPLSTIAKNDGSKDIYAFLESHNPSNQGILFIYMLSKLNIKEQSLLNLLPIELHKEIINKSFLFEQ